MQGDRRGLGAPGPHADHVVGPGDARSPGEGVHGGPVLDDGPAGTEGIHAVAIGVTRRRVTNEVVQRPPVERDLMRAFDSSCARRHHEAPGHVFGNQVGRPGGGASIGAGAHIRAGGISGPGVQRHAVRVDEDVPERWVRGHGEGTHALSERGSSGEQDQTQQRDSSEDSSSHS